MDNKKIFLYFRQTSVDTEHGQYVTPTGGDEPASICIPADSIRMISPGDHETPSDSRLTIYFDSVHNFEGGDTTADEHVTADYIILDLNGTVVGEFAQTYHKETIFGLMSAIEGAKNNPTHNGFITVFDAADVKSNLHIPVVDSVLANAGHANRSVQAIVGIHEISVAVPVTGS